MAARRLIAVIAALAFAALTLSAIALGGNAAGSPVAKRSIIGGKPASFDRWRFTVAIFNEEIGFWCGGSVLNSTTVLTAAHCAKGVKTSNLSVLANQFRVSDSSTAKRIPVSAKLVDPDYNDALIRHDFALLTLAYPTSAPSIKPATAEEDASATERGDLLKLAGWGASDAETFALPGYLRSTVMHAKRADLCRRAFPYIFSARADICAMGDRIPRVRRQRTADCDGDSGGPIVADTPNGRRLVGVVSYGGPVCGIGPAAFARVANDLAFIGG